MSKRTAEAQLTKDNSEFPASDNEEEVTQEREKAPEEVLAGRKIVSVRRGGVSQAKPTTTTPVEEQKADRSATTGGLFGGLSGLAAGIPKDSSPKQSLFGGLSSLAEKSEDKSAPAKDSSSTNLFSSLFSGSTQPLFSSSSFSFNAPAGTAFPSFGNAESKPQTPEDSEEEEALEPEQPAAAGALSDELEGEEQIYQSDCKLYKLTKEETSMKWIEKCIGFVRLLKNKDSGAIRLVVRMKGVYRLALNTGLVAKICKAEKVGNKSVRFNGIEDDASLGMYRVNLLSEDQQESFLRLLPDELKQLQAAAPAE